MSGSILAGHPCCTWDRARTGTEGKCGWGREREERASGRREGASRNSRKRKGNRQEPYQGGLRCGPSEVASAGRDFGIAHCGRAGGCRHGGALLQQAGSSGPANLASRLGPTDQSISQHEFHRRRHSCSRSRRKLAFRLHLITIFSIKTVFICVRARDVGKHASVYKRTLSQITHMHGIRISCLYIRDTGERVRRSMRREAGLRLAISTSPSTMSLTYP